MFLVLKLCFLSFSKQNHAESSRNFVKNFILKPKRAKLDEKSELWAHMGPARALEERKGPSPDPGKPAWPPWPIETPDIQASRL